MPKQSAEAYRAMEERIKQVLKLMRKEDQPKISLWARENEIPYQRLLRRWNGLESKSSRQATGKRLTADQERGLCNFLDQLDYLGASARLSMVRQAANSILLRDCQDPSDPPKVGNHWPQRFLDRHPEYFAIKQQPISIDRKRAQDPRALDVWYNTLNEVIQKHEIQPEDQWNFDESGFSIGMSRDKTIITRDKSRRSFLASSDNKDHVTAMESISAAGEGIPPIFVAKGAMILEPFLIDLPSDWAVTMSESGYANDDIMILYIQHFNKFTAKRQKGSVRLLLMDNYGSHLTKEVIEYCEFHNIIIFTLIPHTSHIIQPLDVGVFQQYKHYHSEALDDAYRSGCNNFNKVEFFAAVSHIRSQAMTKRNIQSGWRRTGILPWNPNLVIDALRESLATPSDSSRDRTPPLKHTPQTRKQLTTLGRTLENDLVVLKRDLFSFIKGARQIAYSAELAFEELARVQRARAERAERQSRVSKQVQKGGLVYSQHVRAAIKDREQDQVQWGNDYVWKRRRGALRRYKKTHKLILEELRAKHHAKMATRYIQQQQEASGSLVDE